MFKIIWDMQLSLNRMIGKDTISAESKDWLFDYTQALEDEVIELKNCVNWKWWSREAKEKGQYTTIIDPKNAKIEAIDMLHFTMSLLQIMNITNLDFFTENPRSKSEDAKSLFWTCERIHDAVRAIKSCTNWKEDITKRTEIDGYESHIISHISFIFEELKQIFWILDMNIDDILSVYKMKHDVNVQRQKDNYSIVNKTEDDNNRIKDQI